MKNELLNFSAMIAIAISPNSVKDHKFTAKEIAQQALALQDALQLLLTALATLACSKRRSALLYRQIKKAQAYCCRTLTGIAPNQLTMEGENERLKQGYHCLLQLLFTLKTDYTLGFNAALPAPQLWQCSIAKQLNTNAHMLLASLKKQKISPDFMEVLKSAFVLDKNAQVYTFQQLDYLLVCQQSVINFCQQPTHVNAESLLFNQLICANFNEPNFLAFKKHLLEMELHGLLNEKAQYDKLCEIERALMSLPYQNQFALFNTRPSAQSQLLAFVTAGIVYFHRKADFNLPQQGMVRTATAMPHYRVKIMISADALAYFIRLLIETELIEAVPKTKVLLFFATHFQTPGIGDELLSAYSLTTKYKQVVQRTADQVRSILRQMLKKVEADFG